MTDRELLELAAKAARFTYNPTVVHEDGSLHGCYLTDDAQEAWPWNPLTDDGDALRLAVKLSMSVHQSDFAAVTAGWAENQNVSITCNGKGPWYWKEWLHENRADSQATTRRAIVRAAAEIGRALAAQEEA